MITLLYAAIEPLPDSFGLVWGLGTDAESARKDARKEGCKHEGLEIFPVTLDQAKRIANGERLWPILQSSKTLSHLALS
jgi:hypothetical protein